MGLTVIEKLTLLNMCDLEYIAGTPPAFAYPMVFHYGTKRNAWIWINIIWLAVLNGATRRYLCLVAAFMMGVKRCSRSHMIELFRVARLAQTF